MLPTPQPTPQDLLHYPCISTDEASVRRSQSLREVPAPRYQITGSARLPCQRSESAASCDVAYELEGIGKTRASGAGVPPTVVTGWLFAPVTEGLPWERGFAATARARALNAENSHSW